MLNERVKDVRSYSASRDTNGGVRDAKVRISVQVDVGTMRPRDASNYVSAPQEFSAPFKSFCL